MDVEILAESYEAHIKLLKTQLKQTVEALRTVTEERDALKFEAKVRSSEGDKPTKKPVTRKKK